MADAYVFKRDGVRRIVEAVRQVERQPDIPPFQQRRPPLAPVQLIRVTAAGTTSGGITYYPGRVYVFNPTDGWADLTDSNSVWLIHPTDADLTTDGSAIYPAMLVYHSAEVSAVERPVFAAFLRPFLVSVMCDGDGNVEGTLYG